MKKRSTFVKQTFKRKKMPFNSFRVVIPFNADLLTQLAKEIIARHEEEGESSPLSLLNMTDFKAKMLLAQQKNTECFSLNGAKEVAFGERDHAIGIGAFNKSVDYYVKSSRDILMGYYKGRETMLGDHGFEVRQSGGKISVYIPQNAKKMIDLAQLILAKNTADGANSPIRGLNIVEFTTLTNTAHAQQELAAKLNRDKIAAFAERNRVLGIALKQLTSTEGTVRFYVTQARDVLLGLHKSHEKLLELWGFSVHEPRKHKKKPEETPALQLEGEN